MSDSSSAETACELVERYKHNFTNYSINIETYHKLLCLCELADSVSDEFCGSVVSINLNPTDIAWSVVVEIDDLVFDRGRNHSFFLGIKNANFIRFYKSTNGMLSVEFGVKDLWVSK